MSGPLRDGTRVCTQPRHVPPAHFTSRLDSWNASNTVRALMCTKPLRSAVGHYVTVTGTGQVCSWETFWNLFPNIFDPQLVESNGCEGKLDT